MKGLQEIFIWKEETYCESDVALLLQNAFPTLEKYTHQSAKVYEKFKKWELFYQKHKKLANFLLKIPKTDKTIYF